MKRRSHGFGSLRLRGKSWYVRYRVNGVLREENVNTSDKTVAENLLKEKLAEVARGDIDAAPQDVTIADLCELVFADYRIRRLRSLKDVEWRYKANIKDVLGPLRAARFGPHQIRQYIQDRRAAGASDTTINREFSIVRRGFTLGRREEPPLVHKVPYIPMLEEDNVRQGFIEEPQYRLLLVALPDDLKAAFVVGYHCGNRLGEIRQLRPDQVHLDDAEIRIEKRQAKSKEDRVIPIWGEMREWLEWQLKRLPPGCPYLFPRANGKPIGSHIKGWDRACASVGLEGLHFHDLRRSAIRNMDRAKIRRELAMAVSGHKRPEVYRRYSIVARGELGEVGEKMAAWKQEQKPKLEIVK